MTKIWSFQNCSSRIDGSIGLQNALNLQGKGVFSDNIVWGNVRQYAIEIDSSDVYGEEEVPLFPSFTS